MRVIKSLSPARDMRNFSGINFHGDKVFQHCHNEQFIFVLKIIFLLQTRIVLLCCFVKS
jgi:hypothetical protein